ncbi:MAG: hypothetical protein KDK91_17475 [Gammaproteobacteria bacterium]|nr:hypothetical protein [Gammaproteobacteria bacterium]
MPLKTSYIFIASMDVDPDKEALFHEVYDTEHVPFLSSVPGVHGVSRTERQPLTLSLGGELKEMVFDDEPKHSAIYEIESPEVLTSAAWAEASERGRWATEVRPFTHNRRHILRKVTRTT